jgi:hypothetical protein
MSKPMLLLSAILLAVLAFTFLALWAFPLFVLAVMLLVGVGAQYQYICEAERERG